MTLKKSKSFTKAIYILALAATFRGGSAQAGDSVSQPGYSWTGFYAGLNAGGGFGTGGSSSDLDNLFNAGRTSGSLGNGFVGGAQGGYTYQVSSLFAVGIEDDFDVTSLSRHGGASIQEAKLPWFGSGRARAGVLLMESRLFVYGTGGLAFGKVEDEGDGKTRIGWTVGGGTEWAVMPNWSVKAEYLYTDLYRDLKTDPGPLLAAKFNTIRIGVNYHF